MHPLVLHEFHRGLNGRLAELHGAEIVADYGDVSSEHAALRNSAGVLDLSFRSRICLTGADRVRFLHGQVTNDVKRLVTATGCYAALVTAKGKMQSDLNIYALPDELLLDFEPGLAPFVSQRLEKFVVADDVQVVDVSPQYGLLSVQGPKSQAVVRALGIFESGPTAEFSFITLNDATLGELYLMNLPRCSSCAAPGPAGAATATGRAGFDVFVPTRSLGAVADRLIAAAKSVGGRACGWQALEIARIEAGIPRFGQDMDETNLPLECGIESRAVSYSKGCYIGQEVLNRIHTIGHVTKELRGLRLAGDLKALPAKGDKLLHEGKDAGYITSAAQSPALKAIVALGYVRREANGIGTELTLRTTAGNSQAKVVALPFEKANSTI